MASTEQKRQKKLAKKRSKEIAKRKRLTAEKNALKSVPGQITAALRSDSLTCYIHGELGGEEICTIAVFRPLPNGHFFSAMFLVDSSCLGVKDSFGRLVLPAQVEEVLDRMRASATVRKCEPAFAKKFVLDAVAWASQFGFKPRGDYNRVREIWRDVDESECQSTFEFGGEDGKPTYVQGPNDSLEFAHLVFHTLQENVGPGNFHYLLAQERDSGFISLESDDDDFEPTS